MRSCAWLRRAYDSMRSQEQGAGRSAPRRGFPLKQQCDHRGMSAGAIAMLYLQTWRVWQTRLRWRYTDPISFPHHYRAGAICETWLSEPCFEALRTLGVVGEIPGDHIASPRVPEALPALLWSTTIPRYHLWCPRYSTFHQKRDVRLRYSDTYGSGYIWYRKTGNNCGDVHAWLRLL